MSLEYMDTPEARKSLAKIVARMRQRIAAIDDGKAFENKILAAEKIVLAYLRGDKKPLFERSLQPVLSEAQAIAASILIQLTPFRRKNLKSSNYFNQNSCAFDALCKHIDSVDASDYRPVRQRKEPWLAIEEHQKLQLETKNEQ